MKEKIKNKILGINEISDDKHKSIVLLLIWIVFIGIIIAYIKNNYSNDINNSNNVIVFNSLETIFNKYDNYNYDVSIKNIDNNIANYKGNINDGINSGTRVTGEEIINYKIEDGFIINSDTNEEIENLYGDYLSFFFIPNNIYSYIKTLSGNENVEGEIKKYSYEYVFQDKPIYFEIKTSKDLIDNIVITYDDFKYDIKFSL